MDLKQHIRSVPDFPKPGILFYDISTLLAHPRAWQTTVQRLAEALRPQLKTVRGQARDEEAEILKQLSDQVRPVLSAEQRTKLDALQNVVDGTHNNSGMARTGINFAF